MCVCVCKEGHAGQAVRLGSHTCTSPVRWYHWQTVTLSSSPHIVRSARTGVLLTFYTHTHTHTLIIVHTYKHTQICLERRGGTWHTHAHRHRHTHTHTHTCTHTRASAHKHRHHRYKTLLFGHLKFTSTLNLSVTASLSHFSRKIIYIWRWSCTQCIVFHMI